MKLRVLLISVGRSAAVLGNGGSFDLCDDFDGVEGTREILEAYKRDAFGDRAAREQRVKGPKIEDLLPVDTKAEVEEGAS